MKFKASLVAATGLAGMLAASAAVASDAHVAPMQDFANSTVKNWVANADLVAATRGPCPGKLSKGIVRLQLSAAALEAAT